jgi:hypothetical protein
MNEATPRAFGQPTSAPKRDPELRRVLLKDLQVARFDEVAGGYQRPVDWRQVHYYASRWNEQGAGTPELSQREDGSLWILDGQHRILGGIEAGVSDLRCKVHFDLSLAAEAQLYLIMNRDRKNQTVWQIWNAEAALADPMVCGITAVCAEFGLTVAHSNRKHRQGLITSPGTLKRIVTNQAEGTQRDAPFNLDYLRNVLRVLTAIWFDTPDATLQEILLGLHYVLTQYGALLNERRLIDRLRRKTVRDVLMRSTDVRHIYRCNLAVASAQAMVEIYNDHLPVERHLPEPRLPRVREGAGD